MSAGRGAGGEQEGMSGYIPVCLQCTCKHILKLALSARD